VKIVMNNLHWWCEAATARSRGCALLTVRELVRAVA
jgi:hypothetical protein